MAAVKVLLCSALLGIMADHYHAADYYQTAVDITKVHFPPRSKELLTSIPSGVTAMNYHNISSLLTSVLEVFQSITAYKNELVLLHRLDNMPPPHEHCFLPDRDLSNYTVAATTHFLSCDHHLLDLLSVAMHRMIAYDKCESVNRQSEYTQLLTKTKSKIDAISIALANITGVQGSDCGLRSMSEINKSSYQRTDCRLDPSRFPFVRRSAEVRPEDRSRPSRLRRPITASIPSSTPSARNPRDTGNLSPTDRSALNLGADNDNTRHLDKRDATPTAASFACSPIIRVMDLYRYTYEVWLGLYYVQVDLTQKKKCLE